MSARRVGAAAGVLLMAMGLAFAAMGCTGAPRGDDASAPASGRVAYLARTQGFWQVWVVAPDGSGARQLTHSSVEKTRASWYPDGQALLVSTDGGDLLRVELEGGGETPVRLPVEGSTDAVLSPDGRHVAFSVSPAASRDDNEIFLFSLADGQKLRRLTQAPGLQHEPAWSRDGRWIYYLAGLGDTDHDILRVSLDGSRREQLTTGRGFHFDVAVGPDGSLAYSNNVTGNYELWVQAPGAAPRRLTDDPALDAAPSFSPDGATLVFESTRAGQPEIWRVSAEGGPAQRVTHSVVGARRPVWYHPGEPGR